MRACEDFEVEKVNKDSDKVDDRVDGDHDGNDNNDVDDDHETDDAVLIFDLLTSAARRCSVSGQPYFLTLCPLLEIIWREENGVKFVRFGRHTSFCLAPGKEQD